MTSGLKKIRSSRSRVSGAVDGVSNASDIASLFARKYEDLYTRVAYDTADMKQISEGMRQWASGRRSTLTRQISFESDYCVTFQGRVEKPQFRTNFEKYRII